MRKAMEKAAQIIAAADFRRDMHKTMSQGKAFLHMLPYPAALLMARPFGTYRHRNAYLQDTPAAGMASI